MAQSTGRWFALAILIFVALTFVTPTAGQCAELVRLTESNWDELVPQGKEVDCNYGDWVLRNEHVVAVIADAVEGRHANMTVRNVGGAVIDFTVRNQQSDQLSAFYPLGGLYQLRGPTNSELADAEGPSASITADRLMVTFQGRSDDQKTSCELTYVLADTARWLEVVTKVTNTSDEPIDVDLGDGVRADGEFEFGQAELVNLFWAYEAHWRQAYGVVAAGRQLRTDLNDADRPGRSMRRLRYSESEKQSLSPGEDIEIVRYVYPAAHPIEIVALAHELAGDELHTVELSVGDPAGGVEAAEVELNSRDGQPYARGRTDSRGRLVARLPAGAYTGIVRAIGRSEQAIQLDVGSDQQLNIALPAPGYVTAEISSVDGEEIPCKIEFRGTYGTPDPHFGPDSAIHGVRNLYYTANGRFRIAIAPGSYEVVISHGPEYDAVFTNIEVARGAEAPLRAELTRSVDTTGWLSADFHSHSTPSGDNTSSQRGRVLNLLAEHIEIAPCTEHNRISIYDPHLEHFQASHRMLTCPGLELTGRPLPINHQNAFPLVRHPHTQDGGAPLTDVDPIVQIERLAMWDNGADKVVQINHPNIVQMVGDRDLDGSPDGGFEKMFAFMDVIEVHPLPNIFESPQALPGPRDRSNAIFHWMQLLNLGYRTPGVVNTDAHWNFHGSGGLRNFVKMPSDDPSQATIDDLVESAERGNMVMSNGPYLEVLAAADEGGAEATVGDDLTAPGGKLQLHVRVQTPNWLQVNRVQLFINGSLSDAHNFTLRSHPQMFHEEHVVFDETVAIELPQDAHLIVACAGEGHDRTAVMGSQRGAEMPVAVGNPIFVDVDGDGFQPSGDMLGLPLPVEPGHEPSKPHRH